MSSLRSLILNSFRLDRDPIDVLTQIGIDTSNIPQDVPKSQLWYYLITLASNEERMRCSQKTYIKSIDEVMSLIENAKNIVAVIGAGASVGPDFRSPGGLYDQIAKSGALDDPYKVFDMDYFVKDPSVFWRFAHLIYPSLHPEHSQAHYFLAELEKRGKLLRCYSQNVDTLEIGIPDEKLRCVHGSWRQNKCLNCGEIYSIEDLRESVNQQIIPVCKKCGGQIKPGIVFFGQRTNIEDEDIEYDSNHADLLIVIGTSLRVAPVSYLPRIMYNVKSILINREPVSCQFNAELLGEGDAIINAINKHLKWNMSPEKEDDNSKNDFVFIEPNKFMLPDVNGNGPTFVETGRSLFLVNGAFSGVDTFA